MHIVDRRQNPKSKSLGNRQRFVRRVKSHVREAVKEAIKNRKIGDLNSREQVSISSGDISEPNFTLDPRQGNRDLVIPGNREYQRGDQIRKPSSGKTSGRSGTSDGEGEDAFVFTLTEREFLELFFEDLELPNLAKRKLKTMQSASRSRAGYANDGSPSRLNKRETMRRSLARRIALKRPRHSEIEELEAEKCKAEACEEPEEAESLRLMILDLRRRMRSVPFLDEVDLRYNRFEVTRRPSTQAVMFCLMDTSASMTESLKDLAKRFYMLLHLFLSRHYRSVELVFIQHTYVAREVDEETFFHGRETGGTVVSSALEEMRRIIQERYPVDDWNIYAAQASDGHNFDYDMPMTLSLLKEQILPLCQYYAYLQVEESDGHGGESALWDAYSPIDRQNDHFARAAVTEPSEIYPVFHQLFERTSSG